MNRDFSMGKLEARKVTIFPEKFKSLNFLKCKSKIKPTSSSIKSLPEVQMFELSRQFCQNSVKYFGLSPLSMQNPYWKMFLEIKNLFVNWFSKFCGTFWDKINTQYWQDNILMEMCHSMMIYVKHAAKRCCKGSNLSLSNNQTVHITSDQELNHASLLMCICMTSWYLRYHFSYISSAKFVLYLTRDSKLRGTHLFSSSILVFLSYSQARL